MSRFRYVLFLSLLAAAAAPAAASWLNDPDNSFEVRLGAEMGFLGVLRHNIQFGPDPYGTKFNYVREGSQNILFPFQRMSAELHLKPRH
ncbi:hypothetical protein JXD38_07940, partial [candidate division WOR-3 bacterium]|nr:hypothetical protein [candidate division WOR-3 bacterium]